MSCAVETETDGIDELLHLRRRHISPEQLRRFERYMAEIFAACGMDLATSATMPTPQRFVRALLDSTQGYEGDAKLVTTFDNECRDDASCHFGQIVEGPIPLFALCEHHALPFHGRAFVGYVARDDIIGISKLTRVVRLFARRFTIQERIGQQIADTLDNLLRPNGVAVYIEAQHLCTAMRGVQESSPVTHTTFWRGVYEDDANLRAEFLRMCGGRF